MKQCTMDENRHALKVHGYVFDSDSDDASGSGKSEFDENYYALRPPSVPLQDVENHIIIIRASDLPAACGITNERDCHEVPTNADLKGTYSSKQNATGKQHQKKSKGTWSLKEGNQVESNGGPQVDVRNSLKFPEYGTLSHIGHAISTTNISYSQQNFSFTPLNSNYSPPFRARQNEIFQRYKNESHADVASATSGANCTRQDFPVLPQNISAWENNALLYRNNHSSEEQREPFVTSINPSNCDGLPKDVWEKDTCIQGKNKKSKKCSGSSTVTSNSSLKSLLPPGEAKSKGKKTVKNVVNQRENSDPLMFQSVEPYLVKTLQPKRNTPVTRNTGTAVAGTAKSTRTQTITEPTRVPVVSESRVFTTRNSAHITQPAAVAQQSRREENNSETSCLDRVLNVITDCVCCCF